MTRARLVHVTLEQEGWSVEIADAQQGQGPRALGLVKHKSALKCRIHSTLINFGRPYPVTDLSVRRADVCWRDSTYLRWALLEATMHALKHPVYRERYQRNKRRFGKQRGAWCRPERRPSSGTTTLRSPASDLAPPRGG